MRNEMRFRQTTQHRDFSLRASLDRQSVRFRRFILLLTLPLVLFAHSARSMAQSESQPAIAQTTLAIFPAGPHDHPVSDEFWQALVEALREELSSPTPEVNALTSRLDLQDATLDSSARVQILRGDRIVPGLQVNSTITIFLHGDCTTNPAIRLPLQKLIPISDALGWVQLRQGHIEPFAHVECDRLAQLLHVPAVNRNHDESNRLMAVAIARVILHEWIHIASQNPNHTHTGITKAEFTADDLLVHPAKPAHSLAAQTSVANDCGVSIPQHPDNPHPSVLMRGGK